MTETQHIHRNMMPIFTCNHIHEGPDKNSNCIAEKSLIITDVVLTVLLIRLLRVITSKRSFNMISLIKRTCLVLSLIDGFYVVYHYGIQSPDMRAEKFFLLESFRYIIMTLICYYYSDKSAGLLRERKKIMKFLKFVLIAGLLTIIVLGSYLMINNTND